MRKVLRWPLWLLEAVPFFMMMGLFRLVGVDAASATGGFLARWLAPISPAHRTARRNLERAFPEKTRAEIAAILDAMWDNLGRTFAEYAHFKAFASYPNPRVAVEGIEIARAAEEIGCLLAVSFHATTDEVRDRLVPINKRWNIATLLAELRDYPRLSNSERITFEYVMLDGVNDSVSHAHELIKLVQDIPCKFNLIPFNSFPGSGFKRSSAESVRVFRDILLQAGLVTTVRKTRGDDIAAACGQLAGQVMDKTRRSANARAINLK